MNQSEAVKLMAVLKGAYPRQQLDEGTVEVYVGFLVDLDYDRANDAVRGLVATSTFFPTIAEIRGLVAETACGLPSVAEALALVSERHRLSDEDAKASPLPPAVLKAYRLVGGGWAFRSSENPSTLRAQFRDIYASIRSDAVREAQTAPAALPPVEALAALEAPSVPLPELRAVAE